MRKNRTNIQIKIDILKCIASRKNGIAKNRLMLKSNTCSTILQKYLDELLYRGFANEIQTGTNIPYKRISITLEGKEYLYNLEKLNNLDKYET